MKANANLNNGGWEALSFDEGALLYGSDNQLWRAKKTAAHDMSLFLMNMAAIGND